MKERLMWVLLFFVLSTVVFSISSWFSVREVLHSLEENELTVLREVRVELLLGEAVNKKLNEMIVAGKEEQIYQFYDRFTENREVTYLLVNNAIIHKVPVHYLFGLAWTESEFYPKAVNGHKNANGSIDFGLMQLNSNTFSDYETEFLMDAANNVRLACSFLLEKYRGYGNWYESLFAYNAGNTEVIKNHTVQHFISVMEFSRMLDVEFSKEQF
jgi:hypothetical protein